MDEDEKVILTRIEAAIKANGEKLDALYRLLNEDRAMLWRVLLVTIAGAFMLVGVRLVMP